MTTVTAAELPDFKHGVEPDPRLLPLAAARDPRVRVLRGSAEHIPLPDHSVDVVHARFA